MTGRHLAYAPKRNGRADPGGPGRTRADPGEIVWTWVAYEDDLAKGKDGPSWVRLDRVLVVPEYSIRREGAVLDRARFDWVAAALRQDHGWR